MLITSQSQAGPELVSVIFFQNNYGQLLNHKSAYSKVHGNFPIKCKNQKNFQKVNQLQRAGCDQRNQNPHNTCQHSPTHHLPIAPNHFFSAFLDCNSRHVFCLFLFVNFPVHCTIQKGMQKHYS